MVCTQTAHAAVTRLGDDVGTRGGAEHLLDTRGGLVEPSVQRTELIAMLAQPERAGPDPSRRLDGRHNIEQGDAGGILAEDKPAVEPALRGDQPRTNEDLKHFREIPLRDLRSLGDPLGG